MLPQLLKAAPLILLAQVFISAGVFFIGGRLLPQYLSAVYAAFGSGGRTLVAAAAFFLPANFLIGWCMGRFDPAMVSPVILASNVLVQIAFTVWVMGARPPLALIPATLLVMAGCVWVSVLLQKSP